MDEKTFKEHLGRKIKQYRKKLNLTQDSLGEKIDRDQRQISLIENGACFPSPETLIKMTAVFNCKMKDLFDFDSVDNIEIIKSNISIILSSLSDEKIRIAYSILKNI